MVFTAFLKVKWSTFRNFLLHFIFFSVGKKKCDGATVSSKCCGWMLNCNGQLFCQTFREGYQQMGKYFRDQIKVDHPTDLLTSHFQTDWTRTVLKIAGWRNLKATKWLTYSKQSLWSFWFLISCLERQFSFSLTPTGVSLSPNFVLGRVSSSR